MGSWNKDRAKKRIDDKIASLPLKDIEIKEYVRDTDLTGLAATVAYRLDGAHLYADILNLNDILHVTDVEGETCHKRTLRFLNNHYRAVHRIIRRVDALLVDFHNQRLHSVFAKPYGDETKRVHRAVATGQLIIDVLAQTGEDSDHPAAKVRIGIDTGKAPAVNNGRRGHREPLFLGEPANKAAKRAGGGKATGIYLTNKARKAIGLREGEKPMLTQPTEPEAAMAKIDIPDDLLARLGKLARPFVDKEPADVIRWLVDERSNGDGGNGDESEPTYSSTAPPDLSHTKVLAAKINGETMAKPNWNRLMEHVVMLAAKKLKNVDALSKMVLAKHVKGEKTDQGFDYFSEAQISIQGQDSNNAWKTTAHILKEMGFSAEVTFSWYDNPKASNPGKAGKFVIG